MMHISVAAIAVDLLQGRTCQRLTEDEIERLGVPAEDDQISPAAKPMERGWLWALLSWPPRRPRFGVG